VGHDRAEMTARLTASEAVVATLALALMSCATAVGRGDTALREGRADEAVRYFQDALAVDPTRLDVRVGLGIALFRTRAWAAAQTTLNAVVAEVPGRADARLYLGLTRLMLGDVSGARANLIVLRGLSIHPRIVAQLDRGLPLLVLDLDPAIRNLLAAELDDAYEWAMEVERASCTAWPPVDPTWMMFSDHSYAPALPSGVHQR
jgi:hypothetical protein